MSGDAREVIQGVIDHRGATYNSGLTPKDLAPAAILDALEEAGFTVARLEFVEWRGPNGNFSLIHGEDDPPEGMWPIYRVAPAPAWRVCVIHRYSFTDRCPRCPTQETPEVTASLDDRLAAIKERDAFSLNETQTEQDRRWLLNELARALECGQ